MKILFGAALLALPFAVPFVHAHGDAPRSATAAVAEQTAWGIAGHAEDVGRTVAVEMDDRMRFVPDRIAVAEGETVRLVVRNRGRLLHELVLGTPDELAKHAALMAKFPAMAHDEPYMTHVGPGKSGEIVWHFNRAGSFEFACLIPGHYEAGMRGVITVVPEKGAVQ